MTARTALLLDIPDSYRKDLIHALKTKGYRLLLTDRNDERDPQLSDHDIQLPADIRKVQDWLDNSLVDIDCMITAASMALEIPPAEPITYPPYHLYETILKGMHKRGFGRIVNLYTGPGSTTGLSMPQLKSIAARYDALIRDTNILFNSVNIACPRNLSPDEEADITRQRLETILWLATTEDEEPRLEFFRGYTLK
jgi:hypothetical protein